MRSCGLMLNCVDRVRHGKHWTYVYTSVKPAQIANMLNITSTAIMIGMWSIVTCWICCTCETSYTWYNCHHDAHVTPCEYPQAGTGLAQNRHLQELYVCDEAKGVAGGSVRTDIDRRWFYPPGWGFVAPGCFTWFVSLTGLTCLMCLACTCPRGPCQRSGGIPKEGHNQIV